MTLRRVGMEDAEAVAALVSERWPEPIDAESVQREWTSPRFDLAADARLADGAFASVWIEGDKAWVSVHGDPAPELLDWALERARERGMPRAFSGCWSGDERVKRAVEAAGFALVRHSYRMRIELGGPVEEPAWPDGVSVRSFRPGDERTFYAVHEETFRDSWEHSEMDEDEWRHFFLEPPLSDAELWLVAEEGGEAAGIAICHEHVTEKGTGWVGVLGVRRPWRRRGLGGALLLEAFAAFRRRGYTRAGLGVDAESLTGAHRLYESVGMRAAHRFDIYGRAL